MSANREDLDAQDGRWWKFDRYVVNDGAIQPAPDAQLQRFDPWSMHRKNGGKHRTVPTHYESLLTLSRRLTFTPGTNSAYLPTEESIDLVKDWCSEFGLLGILPVQTEMITLPPGWLKG